MAGPSASAQKLEGYKLTPVSNRPGDYQELLFTAYAVLYSNVTLVLLPDWPWPRSFSRNFLFLFLFPLPLPFLP